MKEKSILHVLKKSKNSKFIKAILKNCDDCLIQTLSEIIHNVMNGNVQLDPKLLVKLKRYKNQLRKLHSFIRKNKLAKHRRRKFVNQVGGIWGLLAEGVLSALASLGAEKLLKYGAEKLG